MDKTVLEVIRAFLEKRPWYTKGVMSDSQGLWTQGLPIAFWEGDREGRDRRKEKCVVVERSPDDWGRTVRRHRSMFRTMAAAMGIPLESRVIRGRPGMISSQIRKV